MEQIFFLVHEKKNRVVQKNLLVHKKKYRVGKNFKIVKRSCSLNRYYRVLRFSFERKFDKTNFISPKRTPPKSPHRLGLKHGGTYGVPKVQLYIIKNTQIIAFLNSNLLLLHCYYFILFEQHLNVLITKKLLIYHAHFWRIIRFLTQNWQLKENYRNPPYTRAYLKPMYKK